jgi:hypothetical protein
MTKLFSEGRRRITLDSAAPAHVREFARVLKFSMDVNPAEFTKAAINKASGVTQTAAGKHAALILKLRAHVMGRYVNWVIINNF